MTQALAAPTHASALEHALKDPALSGLTPPHKRSVIVLGPSVPREPLKARLLEQSSGWCGSPFLNPPELARQILGISPDRVLGPLARQEVYRMLLTQPAIAKYFKDIRELKRERTFYRKLDLALTASRKTYANDAEFLAMDATAGRSPLRGELMAFVQAYESWCRSQEFWDDALLLREATERLTDAQSNSALTIPARISVFAPEGWESRELAFFDALKLHTEVIHLESPVSGEAPARVPYLRWHTLDDAAIEWVSELCARDRVSDVAVVISDEPEVRRALWRALTEAGVPLSDPRDPLAIRVDEALKMFLIPLRVVSGRFARDDVKSYIRMTSRLAPQWNEWVEEIHSRGIVQGLSSYEGGKLALLHTELIKLSEWFSPRSSLRELSERHLKWASLQAQESPLFRERLPFVASIWEQLVTDVERVSTGSRKAPLLFWLERFTRRLLEAPASPARVRFADGLDVFRYHQFPVRRYRKVYFFGVTGRSLEGARRGDWFWSDRERERLAVEYDVRSRRTQREHEVDSLFRWMASADEIEFRDAEYSVEGSERPSADELSLRIQARGLSLEIEEQKQGVSARLKPSYSAIRPETPSEVRLKPLLSSEWSATDLDSYSRCHFLGLIRGRYRAWDLREPGTELWPEVRGTFLHTVIAEWFRSGLKADPKMLFDSTWNLTRPRGLLRNRRIEEAARKKLWAILELYLEEERSVQERLSPNTIVIDDKKLSYQTASGLVISGRPDRIDEHPTLDGAPLTVLDYKTSSLLPKGRDMIERGYRLQLPFYALAARQEYAREVVGVQYIELTRTPKRSKGILFTQYNGKKDGHLYSTTKANQSLIDQTPEQTWDLLAEQIEREAKAYAQGEFSPRPKLSPRTECVSCSARDACGERRRLGEVDE